MVQEQYPEYVTHTHSTMSSDNSIASGKDVHSIRRSANNTSASWSCVCTATTLRDSYEHSAQEREVERFDNDQ